MKITFIKSGTKTAEYPPPGKPEVAVVGRSNAGKSSFINALTGAKIAKVSSTPGKTRLMNFFDVNEEMVLVDMPGYGFATGDREEVEGWRTMIEGYLRDREKLKGVLLIMDIRREWSEDEQMLREWLEHHQIRWGVVLNKADKLSRSQILKAVDALKRQIGDHPFFPLSSLKKEGLNEIKNVIFKEWIKR
jgi:GTP-binding protein